MKKRLKQLASLVLAVSLLFGSFHVGGLALHAADDSETETAVTDAQLIAQNYGDVLNESEKVILSSSALIGSSRTFTIPSDESGLIAIDAENKTVTVKDYRDGVNTWKPTGAKVVAYNADNSIAAEAAITLTDGKGSFADFAYDSYRVYVDYALTVSVDADTQRLLLNAPAYLARGIVNMNKVNDLRADFKAISDNIDMLYDAAKNGFVLKIGETPITLTIVDDPYDAILALYNDCQGNEDKNLTAYKAISGYSAAANKTAFLLNSGAAVKNSFVMTYDNLKTIVNAEGVKAVVTTAKSLYPNLDAEQKNKVDTFCKAFEILQGIVTKMDDVNADDWTVLDQTLVRADATEAELAALNTAVLAAVRSTETGYDANAVFHDGVEIKDVLTVATATVSAGVDQYKVNVTVKAQVVDKRSENTEALTTLSEVKSATFVLDKSTAKADVENVIRESGVAEDAIDLWDTYYNIGNEFYNVVIAGISDALTEDTNVTVTYVPKTYAVDLWGTAETLPYGYNLRLPKHEDSAKSYDYTVNGALYREDTIYRVTAASVITRAEGQATTKYRVPAVVALSQYPGSELSAEEKAILEALAVKANDLYFRTPDQSIGLVAVAAGENGSYTVTAAGYASGLLSGSEWTPVQGYVKNASGETIQTFNFEGGSGTFTCDVFDHVEVTYALTVSDVDSATLSAIVNIPYTLVNEAVEQKQVMNMLVSGDLYKGLQQVKPGDFNVIKSMANSYSSAAQNAVAMILDNCIADDKILLLDYLDSYIADGLVYYYTKDNALKIANQIKILGNGLNVLWADENFQRDLETSSIGQYKDRLASLKNALSSVEIPSVSEYIDIDSSYLSALVAALDNATGKVTQHTVTSDLLLSETIIGAAPDKVSVTVNVQVLASSGDVIKTEKKSLSFPIGTALSEADIAEIRAAADELAGRLGIDSAHYKVTDMALNVGDVLNSSAEAVFAWSPVSYTVKIDGEADQVFFADGNLTITLPAYTGEQSNIQYRYTIGDESIVVGKTEGTYRFASLADVDALFGETRTLTITREKIDAYREKVLSLVSELNRAIANNGLTFADGGKEELLASFIPMEDADGNLTIVLRVFATKPNASYRDLLTAVARALTGANYIGLDGKVFWDGQVSVQSVVDMVLSSGLGFDTLTDLIDDNGAIRNLTETQALSPIGVVNGEIAVASGKRISHMDMLGGKLIGSTLQIGNSAEDNLSVGFYLTLADIGHAEALKKLDGAVGKIKNYITGNLAGGSANVTMNIPDSVYPFFLTGMLILDYADIADVENMDLAESIDYELSVLKALLADPNFSLQTIENTLAKLGKAKDLSEYEKLFNFGVKFLKHALNNGEITGTSVGGVYTASYTYNLRDLLTGKLGLDDATLKLVKDDTLTVNFNVTVANLEKEYEALVIDYNAGVSKMIASTKDLAATLAGASQNTVVVLLKDVTFDSVTINNPVFIDLNGHALNGNINAAANVRIFDSTLDTASCGTVNGTLTGSYTIAGGRFTTDVTALLKKGYVQDANGIVHNKLYTIEKAEQDIRIVLAGDFLTRESIPDIKTFAFDVIADLVNLYTASSASLDGNTLYSVEIEDITSFIGTSKGAFADTVLGYLNTAGISSAVNAFLADLTDFGALKTALENGDVLMSYTLEMKPWNVSVGVKDDYLTAGIGSREEVKTCSISFVLDENATAEQKQTLIDLVSALDEILAIDALNVNVTDLGYNGRLTLDGKGTVNATLDLTADGQYAAIIAASVASVTARADYKTELVTALKEYLETGHADAMKTALDKMTTAEAIAAVKKLGSTDFGSMLTSLDVASDSLVAFESTYDGVISLAAAALGKLGVSGDNRTLGGLENAYGVYNFARTNWKKCDVDLTLKLLNPDALVEVPEILKPTVTITANDPLIRGYKVDATGGYIFLDVAPKGMTVKDISRVIFTATNDATVSVTVTSGAKTRADGELICNGDAVTAVATNAAGTASVTYTIIILGDVNGNGEIDAGDAVLMANYYVNGQTLSGVALLAADTNQNGEIDAGDAAKNATKYTYAWDDKTYKSALGN